MKNKRIFKTAALSTGLLLSGGVINELIINGEDWEPVKTQSEIIKKLSESQYKLVLSNGYFCNGFAVTPKIIMTNNHCVPNTSITAVVSNDDKTEFNCNELLHTSERHDYSLILCDGDFTPVEFDANPVQVGDLIYTLHTNCNYYENPFCPKQKLLSRGKVLAVNSVSMSHDSDTLGGSSGSPIFRAGKLVAIHNSGSGNDGYGNGSHNGGKTARGILSEMPLLYRDMIKIKGNITLPQSDSVPFAPKGKSKKYKWVKKKPSLWVRFKCLFKRGC